MPKRVVIGEDISQTESKKKSTDASSYNTMRPAPAEQPIRSFNTHIAFVFALTAVMTAAILSAVLAYVWEGQFSGYARQNMQNLADTAARSLATHYDRANGWTSEALSYIEPLIEDNPQLGIQLLDAEGNVLYSDLPQSLREDPQKSANPLATNQTSRVSVVSSEVVNRYGIQVGVVRMSAVGSDALLTKEDYEFRQNSYNAIFFAGVIAVALASGIGYFASRKLLRPINKITSTAALIRNGHLDARTGLSGDDEIGRLGETFDAMALSLEKDIKQERRLTGDVAHELRTPLMAIQATVEAMQDKVLPADEKNLQIVDDEVRRLSRLVDMTLHLARIENTQAAFNPEHTDIVYLVQSLTNMQEQLFIDKGLRLRFDDKTPHHELYADIEPDGIKEAITNLLSNAMRYTPTGGWVVVSVAQDHGDALISVRDTGIGIARDDIPKTFSRFWRSDASRERESGGLGVGLSITKGIVDRHNGTITVESALGAGTTFTIRIPCDQLRHGRSDAHNKK